MRTVLTIATMCFVVLGLTTTAAETELGQQQSKTEVQQQHVDGTAIKSNVTVIAARFLGEYVTPMMCTYAPDYCTKHELHSSRGIQSYLATAGTLFAGVLGIILTKIKILVIVSLMTMVIGKMLLFYAFLKTDLHHHHSKPHHHVPFVKYTKDKYYIKHTPTEHNHDVFVESESPTIHSPYYGHQSGGVSYYR